MDSGKSEVTNVNNEDEEEEEESRGAEGEAEEEAVAVVPQGARAEIGLEEHEIIDDSTRTYLHEIGRVKLLKAVEEKNLARLIERGRYLVKFEDNYFDKQGRYPSEVDTVLYLLSVIPSLPHWQGCWKACGHWLFRWCDRNDKQP